MGTGTTLRVHKQIVIDRSREDTFRIFTEEFGSWWPISSHSIHEADVTEVVFEGREGGRIYERTADGNEYEWGTILEWDAPGGFTVSWKPNLDPDAHRTTWVVRFEAIDDEKTRVDLIHSGWENFGEEAKATRSGYDTGWDIVLADFISATQPA